HPVLKRAAAQLLAEQIGNLLRRLRAHAAPLPNLGSSTGGFGDPYFARRARQVFRPPALAASISWGGISPRASRRLKSSSDETSRSTSFAHALPSVPGTLCPWASTVRNATPPAFRRRQSAKSI